MYTDSGVFEELHVFTDDGGRQFGRRARGRTVWPKYQGRGWDTFLSSKECCVPTARAVVNIFLVRVCSNVAWGILILKIPFCSLK